MKLSHITLACILFLFSVPLITNAQIALIANKSLNAKAVDKNAVTNLYTLQSNEVGSQKVKLFFLTTENETNKKFLDALGKSFQDLKKIWLRAKLTGNGFAPEFVSSESEMLDKVGSTPNSIGFVNQKDAGETVKVIAKF